jgi:thiol-disulfide isomerase/thioredoxin
VGQRRQRMKRQQERRQAAQKPASSSALGRRALIWGGLAAVAVVILVVGVLAARGTGPAQATSSASGGSGGGDVIDVSGTDPITGKDVSLASFKGKPTVLAIWASWCHGCNEEALHLAEVAKKRSDVAFVGLNYSDSTDGAQWFYGEYGWDFPSIGDPTGAKAISLGLQGTPTTIFLDSEHREVTRILGATDVAGFESAIDQAVNAT